MAAIGVIVAMRGAGESEVVAQIEAHPDLAVVRRCAEPSEALAAAQAGLAMAVVLSPGQGLDAEAVAVFRSCGLVVVGVATDPLEVQELARLGVEAPESVADSVALQARGARLAPPASSPPPAPGRGVMIAVWGTHGAPGRTTVAVNIAAELAHAGREVLVADLDTYAPSVATAFALEEESAGVAALAHAAARGLDPYGLLDRYALPVSARLRVLPGLVRAGRWQELSPAALASLWPPMRGAADVVVVDVAPPVEDAETFAFDPHGLRRDGATGAVLAEADAVVVVGAAEPRQLQRLVATVVDAPVKQPVVVVNRMRAGVAGARPELEVATLLGRLAGVPEMWPLPWDPRACEEADRTGRTLLEVAPRSALRRAIQALAKALADSAAERRAGEAAAPRAAAAARVAVTD